MRVIVCHNFYQLPGGEDQVFADEITLLRDHGHEVETFTVHNREIDEMGKLSLVGKTIWNREMRNRIAEAGRRFKPDIFHFHNTFPLISPAAYSAARDSGAAVVQTLHNYRLVCVSAQFFREGSPCEDCLGKKIPWPGLVHRCYRDSFSASAVTAAMLVTHRVLGTWNRKVDAFIALTEFAREKFVFNGLSPEQVVVKPNFVSPDPGFGQGDGDYGLFVGRFDAGKGVQCLLDAWEEAHAEIPLRFVGDGPMADQVRQAQEMGRRVQWLGQLPLDDVYKQLKGARFSVIPSLWYEGLPKTLVESFACGTPVIGSNLGAMQQAVTHGKTGLLFKPGDPADLARQIRWMLDTPAAVAEMRNNARREFENKYSAEMNYQMLSSIYDEALKRRHGEVRPEEEQPLVSVSIAGRDLHSGRQASQVSHSRAIQALSLSRNDLKSVR